MVGPLSSVAAGEREVAGEGRLVGFPARHQLRRRRPHGRRQPVEAAHRHLQHAAATEPGRRRAESGDDRLLSGRPRPERGKEARHEPCLYVAEEPQGHVPLFRRHETNTGGRLEGQGGEGAAGGCIGPDGDEQAHSESVVDGPGRRRAPGRRYADPASGYLSSRFEITTRWIWLVPS